MLIEFSVENFLSFRERVTFSMLPYNGYKNTDGEVNTSPTQGGRTKRLLTSAMIYGANASGKTNFINAMVFFKQLVAGQYIPDFIKHKLKPFGFLSTLRNEPTYFEIKFFVGETIYSYEIGLLEDSIVFEELFAVVDQPKRRNRLIFCREDGDIKFGSDFSGKRLFEMTRPDRSFLNLLYELNNPVATEPMEWIGYNFRPVSTDKMLENITAYTLEEHKRNEAGARRMIGNFVKAADVWLEKINTSERKNGTQHNGVKASGSIHGEKGVMRPQFVHYAEDEKGKKSLLTIEMEDESAGTKKMFALAGPIIDTLLNGNTLVIDELACSLHPLLTKEIIRMFHTPKFNRHGAQLIFNTHDVTLLDNDLVRRDQVWFTEKGKDGHTDLFSMVEFNARREDPIGSRYLRGSFGAVPLPGMGEFIDALWRKN